MTDAQIEQIARAYCRKLGLDPDEYGGLDPHSPWHCFRWELHTAKAREFIAMREAIDEVLGEKGAGG